MDGPVAPGDSRRNKPFSFSEADAGKLLRLANALHAPAEGPSDRKRRLIEGVCRLVGADAGFCVVIRVNPSNGDREVVSVVGAEAKPRRTSDPAKPSGRLARAGASADMRHPWHHSPDCESLLRAGGIRQHIEWGPIPVSPAGLGASLAVGRRGGGNRRAPFAPRDYAIVRVVHAATTWLYDADAALASPEVLALPPRRRHVLQYLLAGEEEADVAGWVGTDVETLRSEIRAVSRILDPPLRDHLLAR